MKGIRMAWAHHTGDQTRIARAKQVGEGDVEAGSHIQYQVELFLPQWPDFMFFYNPEKIHVRLTDDMNFESLRFDKVEVIRRERFRGHKFKN